MPIQSTPVKTEGVSPKVPIQAIVTVLAFILTFFAIELPAEVALAISVLFGGGAGYEARPGRIVPK